MDQRLDTYLIKFGCDQYSTIEEVKTAYRRLALKNHPDHGGTSRQFIEVNDQYRYIIKTHRPGHRPPPSPKSGTFNTYYHIIERECSSFDLPLPEKVLSKQTVIYVMDKYGEFRITLPEGMEIPKQLKVDVHRKTYNVNLTYAIPRY